MKIKRLAAEYIDWATDQFNRDHKFIPANARLCQFVIERGISREMHCKLLFHLINVGVL